MLQYDIKFDGIDEWGLNLFRQETWKLEDGDLEPTICLVSCLNIDIPHLIWFGLDWFDLVWIGLVWFGLDWIGLIWFG